MKSVFQTLILLLSTILLAACGPLWGAETTVTTTPAVFWTIDPSTPLPFATFTPAIVSPTPTITPIPSEATSGLETSFHPILYYVQAGDTLPAIAAHFGVEVEEIQSSYELSPTGLLIPETPLLIPQNPGDVTMTPNRHIIPDSEIVYSPSAIDFNTTAYVAERGGYLNTYEQWLKSTGWTSGAEAVEQIAIENSINPRLLLGLIEYESGWVLGQPTNLAQMDYPLGYINFQYRMLYQQMIWAVQELGAGYYGWRSGTLTELILADGTVLRISPDQNAGTVALQHFFARRFGFEEWLAALDPNSGFPALYQEMFGDPYARAALVEPLFPPSVSQPPLTLPFEVNKVWSFTGGPHSAWGFNQDESLANKGALAALDFAPAADVAGCEESTAWVLASASGRVVRTGNGVVMLDLDGDGHEQTGWNLLYMHIAEKDRVPMGAWLQTGDRIGHPSCEGGESTGTHVHIARKFHGEWVLADGPLPFIMSGWVVHAGDAPYRGTMTKDDKIVISNQNGIFSSQIIRQPGE